MKSKDNMGYREYLLSDENIYLSIYSLNSYVFEYDLLDANDRELYHSLQDKFDKKVINKVILKVRKRIEELLNKDEEFIEVKVYFKPKKMSKDGLEFRPLHTTDLITQIAIVAMLHLFVYEIPEKKDYKLLLSNLSRLIPSDFYGNRVSTKPECLFKSWKKQYQKYNQNSNDALKKYHTSLEYKYEVTLDLENFFPTINPIIIYHYIVKNLPAHLKKEDMNLMKRLLRKLLFCKLVTQLDEKMLKQYYKAFKSQTNNKETVKKSKDINVCGNIKQCEFARGIAQGLPQSYFLGNIYMIIVSRIFRNEFSGASYFYVDDSVIFTNDVIETEFKEQLKEINKQIEAKEREILQKHSEENLKIYPCKTKEFYESYLYGVHVHLEEKSAYTRLDSLDEGEVYLKSISRQMSQAGSDFFKMHSDEENKNLEKKFAVLSEQVKIKSEQLEKSEEPNDSNVTKKFKDRLTRYYKFFEYRKQKLAAMRQPENKSTKAYKEELKEIIYGKELLKGNNKILEKIQTKKRLSKKESKTVLECFVKSYSADIWTAAVGMYQIFADKHEIIKLRNYVVQIDELCFGERQTDFSYLEQTYRELIKREEGISEEYLRILYDDPYKSLKQLVQIKLKLYANKHYEVIDNFCKDFQKMQNEDILKFLLDNENGLFNKMKVVCANTQRTLRMVMNAIYSYLFNVEISDQPILAKNSKKGLTYGELRILSFLRNPLFNIEEFQKREILLDNGQNEHTVDYSIMRVIEIFYSFVKEPVRIDNLIVTHKYICDVWKNGSKHLYFYTLHNQEHAIVLIQNIVKLINTIDFLKISSIDYYILFLACYLHDISMVKIPACDSFLLDTDKADELAKTLLDSYNEEFNKANLTKNVQGNDIDILSVKKYMLDSYRKIDNYFEEAVRSKHANDSAAEIRKRSELNYLDTSMRELVAEVSEAHGADERDIYGIKSVASKQLISIKFDKILLRLADLLDMSSYRVSKPILYHNVEQMSEESAFHWISHLLTKGYSLRTEYEITDNAHVLAPKNIIEKLVLEIPVNISQMSALTCGRTCKKVGIDRNRLSQQGIVLVCGQECKDNGNQERNCNFLCKWFCVKNENLIKELAALKEYLNRNKNNYFKSAIESRIKCNDRTSLDARQFEILNEYIGKM